MTLNYNNRDNDKQYIVSVLPRSYRGIEDLLTKHKQYKIIHFGKSLDFMIMEYTGERTMENKRFIVKEMPNNPQKIENLVNEMFDNGFKVSHMNDYSIVFEKAENKKG